MHRFPYVEVEVSVRARNSLPGIDVDRRHASLSYTPRHKLGVRGDLLRPGPRRLVDLARSGAAVNVRALTLVEGGALRSLLTTADKRAPITGGVYLKAPLEADVEHLVPAIQEVDVVDGIRLADRLLVHGLQVGLGQQRRELFQQGVFLQLIAEAPGGLRVDPDGVADQAQLLRRDQSADLEVPAPHEERVQGGVPRALVQVRAVGEVVDDYQDLVQAAHFELLARLRDLALLVDDARIVSSMYCLIEGLNTAMRSKQPRYCSRIMLIRATVLPLFEGPTRIFMGNLGTTGSASCFTW